MKLLTITFLTLFSVSTFAAKTLEKSTLVITKDENGNRQYLISYSLGSGDYPGKGIRNERAEVAIGAGNKNALDALMDAILIQAQNQAKAAHGIP